MLNENYKEMLQVLLEENVKFIVISLCFEIAENLE